MWIKIPKGWEMPERMATPESVYLNRRKFMQSLGVAGLGALVGPGVLNAEEQSLYPAKRNPAFKLDRALTAEKVAARYNNFYEFTTDKEKVADLVDRFETRPWEIEVGGEVEKPRVYDLDDLLKRVHLEERLYRFRCVEAWAMAVPWTGFPFKKLIEEVQPKSSAKYVRMLTFMRPKISCCEIVPFIGLYLVDEPTISSKDRVTCCFASFCCSRLFLWLNCGC